MFTNGTAVRAKGVRRQLPRMMRQQTKAGIMPLTVSVTLRATRPAELDSVLEMEAAASAAPFII